MRKEKIIEKKNFFSVDQKEISHKKIIKIFVDKRKKRLKK